MDIRISHLCLLNDFLDAGFNTSKISDHLMPSVQKVMQDNNLTIPDDWILIFEATYNNGKVPMVTRNKVGAFLSDKMKYVKIVIPIPLECV